MPYGSSVIHGVNAEVISSMQQCVTFSSCTTARLALWNLFFLRRSANSEKMIMEIPLEAIIEATSSLCDGAMQFANRCEGGFVGRSACIEMMVTNFYVV